jgi:dihydroneopterin aldolase
MREQIILDGIQIMAHVGVPDEERARAQKLEVSVTLDFDFQRAARDDELSESIDYDAVRRKTIEVVTGRPRSLIETVADEVAGTLLLTFHAARVDVAVRKFIFQDVRSVAVRLQRSREEARPFPQLDGRSDADAS